MTVWPRLRSRLFAWGSVAALLAVGLVAASAGVVPNNSSSVAAHRELYRATHGRDLPPQTESASGSVDPSPPSQAKCGPGSRPETGPQGRSPAADGYNGRPANAYPCNAIQVSKTGTPGGDLPAGAAAAARAPEPSLPVPRAWPFPDAFARTSGTTRMISGALESTSFVYDATGASGSTGFGAGGSYTYPEGPAHNDGADIFRAAVGLTGSATLWRVDWNTLADRSLPIAAWTFDTDDKAATGVAAWPAAANVSSPGIEKALVVSAKGAQLINAVTGTRIAALPTQVDMAARSFIVTVPRSVLSVKGSWRIRLAAGLADSTGAAFAVPTTGSGPAAATAPRVYDIGFRTVAQEPGVYAGSEPYSTQAQTQSTLHGTPVVGAYHLDGVASTTLSNGWNNLNQATTLATGDISKFSHLVFWAKLAARAGTPPPLVHGWSTRWYVTDLDLGQGFASPTAQPALLGRIQPYAVYVPTTYKASKPAPLTWMLHPLFATYNWAAGGNPRLTQELCEARGSICVSPEGFGGSGVWAGMAEHDFWQVWREVADAFRVSSDRTVISGMSMGGDGTFGLGTTYPSAFSQAMSLSGSGDHRCPTLPAGESFPAPTGPKSYADRSANLRWVPIVISNPVADELSLYALQVANVEQYRAAGVRFAFFSPTNGEHNVNGAADAFSAQVAALKGAPKAAATPGTIDYTWCPTDSDPKLGLGPTSVYWLSGLSERSLATNTTSRVVADNSALPEPAVRYAVIPSVAVTSDGPPTPVLTGSWLLGARPRAAAKLTLDLTNVATLTLDTAAARLPHGSATVDSDGPATLTLINLPPRTLVIGAARTAKAGPGGTVTITLRPGTSRLTWTDRH